MPASGTNLLLVLPEELPAVTERGWPFAVSTVFEQLLGDIDRSVLGLFRSLGTLACVEHHLERLGYRLQPVVPVVRVQKSRGAVC